jgi:hypothetical protein
MTKSAGITSGREGYTMERKRINEHAAGIEKRDTCDQFIRIPNV